ncbi:LysE family transporter [Ruegeria atlantica]|uniref:LysE family transporter n=1 Tax=Ruegeria atlantica TaxID=81569 RepID=UPI003593B2DA
MVHGERAGCVSSLAFHLASYLHIFAAAFGVSVLLVTVPSLLAALNIVGGCYLIWMCFQL